jgi:phosphoribosylformimino-5-aminoimidazole carboxamide ribotide isomerase
VIIYPAIDLKDGDCVRLIQGDMSKATVFNQDPAAQAAEFQRAGFAWIHVVDLNGAVEGRPVNAGAVAQIVGATSLPVQLGGGIRDQAGVEHWLGQGVSRVVLGTLALRNPDIAKALCVRYPGKIAIGIDARGGRVAVEGWTEVSDLTAVDLARRFEDVGAAAVIYTDIDRDGTMTGPNVQATADLAEVLSTPVIASGGVSCLDDLKALKAIAAKGVEGVIIGRALYDGRVDPALALDQMAGQGQPC